MSLHGQDCCHRRQTRRLCNVDNYFLRGEVPQCQSEAVQLGELKTCLKNFMEYEYQLLKRSERAFFKNLEGKARMFDELHLCRMAMLRKNNRVVPATKRARKA